jgi:23S rRNA pseudouridine1911/1915/1917 synthase
MDRAHGKPSLTELRILVRFAGYTLVEALPRTGRTHQIRAHLSALGFPLAGDKLYGSIASSKDTLIARPALHALSLEICYPDSQNPLRFQAPYAADFEAVLQSLL